MGRIGPDIHNRSSFFPTTDKLRVFDRLDITVRVYNQFGNDIMNDLLKNSEENFGKSVSE